MFREVQIGSESFEETAPQKEFKGLHFMQYSAKIHHSNLRLGAHSMIELRV